MMRKTLHFSLLFLISIMFATVARAQPYYNQGDRFLKYNSVWSFYINNKLNFNSGTVSTIGGIGGGMSGDEGCASVADPLTGALLFYSNGDQCWNASNNIMPNGSGLLGNATNRSTTQGTCIVPVPGETTKYYLFSLESMSLDATGPTGVYYSIVDMSLNGGLGDLVASSKNTPLDTSSMLGEAMIAVPGNNCDVWLLLHTRANPVFKAYRITNAGINPAPVISTAGSQVQGVTTVGIGGFVMEQEAYEQSALTISPDRSKLAVSAQHIGGTGMIPVTSTTGRSWGGLLCNFDANTGIVSGGILVDTMAQYSAAFSPDNSKLYYTTVVPGSGATQVNQVSITSNDSATIAASKVVLQPNLSSMQLISLRAYQDSIYVMNPDMLSLDRINKPNLSGTACDYQSNAISFPATTSIGYSLPSEVVYAAAPDTVRSRVLDSLVCSDWGNGITLRPVNNTLDDTYTWSNGSTDSTLTTMTEGTWWVKYGNSCHYRVDTFVLTGSDLDPIITVNLFDLSTTMPYTTYQWYLNNVAIPGATNNIYTVTQNGAYTVVVSDGTCTDTSAVYNVTNAVGIDELQQLASQIKVYPNPTQGKVYIDAPVAVNITLAGIEGRVLHSKKNVKHFTADALAPGVYLLRISDKYGHTIKVEKLIRK